MNTDDIIELYDGELYDAREYHFEGELEFWSTQAKKYGTDILELCCGTGRITIPLALEGFNVTGIDLSKSMLSKAKKNAVDAGVDVDWLIGDMRNFALDQRFNMIFIGFNSMLHLLENIDIESMLSCVRGHLIDGGCFALSIFNPDLSILNRDPNVRYTHAVFTHPKIGKKITIEESVNYDKATQINHVTLYYSSEGMSEKTEPLDIRILYPQEIDYILSKNGFKIINKYGDYSMDKFTSNSPSQILVCEKES